MARPTIYRGTVVRIHASDVKGKPQGGVHEITRDRHGLTYWVAYTDVDYGGGQIVVEPFHPSEIVKDVDNP